MLKELLPANIFEKVWAGGSEKASKHPSGDPILSALGFLSETRGDHLATLQKILSLALDLTAAERMFFFDVPGRVGGEEFTLGQCLTSINIDLESVLDPESKVPLVLIKEVLASGEGLLIEDLQKDPELDQLQSSWPSRCRAVGVVPLEARGEPVGLLFFDHRFQPLKLDQEKGRTLTVLCQVLSILHHRERVVAENHSLWKDIAQIKERTTASTVPLVSVPSNRAKPTRSGYRGDYSFIIGSSTPIHDIFQLLDRVSKSNAAVLINGESGTGKELVATAVHKNSPRNNKPFVSENCGALTETLLESELFGYVKGAFTGATRDNKGLFETAHTGTLFLDEVGDMSPSMQKKLLRALQEKVIRKVGGKDYINVDVRLICATNKDLLEECRQGRFREDLYYRINVINIKVPPLRDRKEDIPELVEFFLGQLEEQVGQKKALAPEALKRLVRYPWPGNIRELQNEVKRLYTLSDDAIGVEDLSDNIREENGRDLLHGGLEKELIDLPLKAATEKLERELIYRALVGSRGNKSMVAKKLQIPKTSLYNKINKYKLENEIA